MMKCNKQRKPSNKGCEGNACNPFMACVYGNFYALEKTGLTFSNLVTNSIKSIIVDDNRLSDNISECWHPPRKLLFQYNS